MAKHLQRDLEDLKQQILAVGTMVEEAVNDSILAAVGGRPDLAEKVRNGDARIDRREVEVEDDCLKILALHQPVAADLRFVVTALKVNNDLERIGDLATNIANRALHLNKLGGDTVIDLTAMSQVVIEMMRDSLDALVKLDVDTAWKVCRTDNQVDDLHRDSYTEIQDIIRNDIEKLDRAVSTLSISRYLERIADLATNIAEDVIFLVEGEVVRHGPVRNS